MICTYYTLCLASATGKLIYFWFNGKNGLTTEKKRWKALKKKAWLPLVGGLLIWTNGARGCWWWWTENLWKCLLSMLYAALALYLAVCILWLISRRFNGVMENVKIRGFVDLKMTEWNSPNLIASAIICL